MNSNCQFIVQVYLINSITKQFKMSSKHNIAGHGVTRYGAIHITTYHHHPLDIQPLRNRKWKDCSSSTCVQLDNCIAVAFPVLCLCSQALTCLDRKKSFLFLFGLQLKNILWFYELITDWNSACAWNCVLFEKITHKCHRTCLPLSSKDSWT